MTADVRQLLPTSYYAQLAYRKVTATLQICNVAVTLEKDISCYLSLKHAMANKCGSIFTLEDKTTRSITLLVNKPMIRNLTLKRSSYQSYN